MVKNTLYRSLPAVEDLLNDDTLIKNTQNMPRTVVVQAVREALADYRQYIQKTDEEQLKKLKVSKGALVDIAVKKAMSLVKHSLTGVINATGVVIHTNLGRSVLAEQAVEAVTAVASGYCALEMSLETGRRNIRGEQATALLRQITGAEDALIVNNNAAAMVLILSTFAKGRDVIVSRGEQVEVGGSFRIPDVMKTAGSTLVEVGATNKTNCNDYENAISAETALLMKIHTSNYAVIGFTESVSLGELNALGRQHGIPVVYDLGGGALVDFSTYTTQEEPTVQAAVSAGTDLVCFSGDKLLGAAQAGIIVGKRQFIEPLRKNQLLRALRVDKLTLAAVTATLQLYLDPERARTAVPTVRMLQMSYDELATRAETLADIIRHAVPEWPVDTMDETSPCGGGALPTGRFPTRVVRLTPLTRDSQSIADALRHGANPVVARLKNDCILFDTRTLNVHEFDIIGKKLKEIIS